MTELYKKNIQYLEKNDIVLKSESVDEENLLTDVFGYKNAENDWWLQSCENMDLAVDVWCNQFEISDYRTVIMIFGIGYIGYISALAEKYPNNKIIAYEPCEDIFKSQLDDWDLEKLFLEKNISIILGENRKARFKEECGWEIDYTKTDLVKYSAIPNYIAMFHDEYQEYVHTISLLIMQLNMAKNTKVKYEDVRGKNFLYNIYDMVTQSGLIELAYEIQKNDVFEYPVVIVSAGPSLDKNIDELKEYKGKAFIICTDMAVKTMNAHGVVPDMICCVDPNKAADYFENEEIENVALATQLCVNRNTTKFHKGRRFYTSAGDAYGALLLDSYGKKLEGVWTGGSVANTAFSFARMLGFKTFIFIGQDLAYPDNQLHTKNAYDGDKSIDISSDKYFPVESIDGGTVLTEANMDEYRKWFEEQVRLFDELTFIDATEGGAKIHGMEIATLKDALAEKCPKKKVDFEKIISETPYFYTEESKKIMQNRIDMTREKVPEIIKKLKAEKKVFDELDALNRKGNYTSKKFKKCIEKIGQINEFMDTDLDASIFRLYGIEDDYNIQDKLKSEEGNVYQEIKLIVEVGRDSLDAQIRAGEKLIEEWKNVMNEA